MRTLPQYTILRFDLNKFTKDNKFTIDARLLDTKFKKYKTLNKESELFRIVNHIRKININDIESNIYINKKYPIIQDIITIKVSRSSKEYYRKSTGEITVNYMVDDDKIISINYKRLLSSSGHIRNGKIVYCNSKIYDDIHKILLCGMPEDMKVKALSKYNAHYALVSTDGYPLSYIPRIVVVPDLKHDIEEYFDVVEEFSQDDYSVIQSENKISKEICPSDGAGLIDVRQTIKISKEIGLKYLPSSFLIRAIPGIKGNLYTFDIKRYAKEKNISKVTDVWGKEWELFDEDNNLLIDCFLTASMFKFHDKYNSFDEWYRTFVAEYKGYKRTFNICDFSKKLSELKDIVPLSYQPLQSIDLDTEQIEEICEPTIKSIEKISKNVNEFIKFRGIEDGEDIPDYYKLLKLNKNMFYDEWIQKKVKEDIEGIKKRSYLGGIYLDGNYQVLGIDCVLLAEHIFKLPNKNGVIPANSVYSRYWDKKEVDEIAIIRFPHISHEYKVSSVINIKECSNPDIKYMKYQRATICISGFDSTDLRLQGADHDNDSVVSLSSKVLIQASRNMKNFQNTVIHVKSFEDKKENKQYSINDIKSIINTDDNAMSSSIGLFVNKITILWSLLDLANTEDEKNRIQNYIKIMNVVCSKVVDFAKTGIRAKIPNEIIKLLSENRLPNFMRHRYPSKVVKQNKINQNKRIIDPDAEMENLFSDIDCNMNRICGYLENKLKDIKLEVPQDITLDFNIYYKKRPDEHHSVYYKPVLNKLYKLKKEHDKIAASYATDDVFGKELTIENSNEYRMFYNYCKNSLLSICSDINKLVDCLVYAFYEDKSFYLKNPDKSILFNCFSDVLISRVTGKELKVVETNEVEKVKRSKKTIKKLKKKSNARKNVDLKIYNNDDSKLIDITNNINLEITKTELQYIKKSTLIFDERRLLLTCLVLGKVCKNNNCDFKIYVGVKDNTKIKKSDIINLSCLNYKQYEKYMTQLCKNDLIKLELSKTGTSMLANVPKVNNCNDTSFVIENLNDCKKYFKYLR